MNTAAASVIKLSAAWPPILNRIRNTRAFLRKLSLNAEKNWHQNSGAKRRDHNRGLDSAMASKPMPKTTARCQSRALSQTGLTSPCLTKSGGEDINEHGFRGGAWRRR